MFEKLLNAVMEVVDDISEGLHAGIGATLGIYDLIRAGERGWALLLSVTIYSGLLVGGLIVLVLNTVLPFFGPLLGALALGMSFKMRATLGFKFGFAIIPMLLASTVCVFTGLIFILIGMVIHA